MKLSKLTTGNDIPKNVDFLRQRIPVAEMDEIFDLMSKEVLENHASNIQLPLPSSYHSTIKLPYLLKVPVYKFIHNLGAIAPFLNNNIEPGIKVIIKHLRTIKNGGMSEVPEEDLEFFKIHNERLTGFIHRNIGGVNRKQVSLEIDSNALKIARNIFIKPTPSIQEKLKAILSDVLESIKLGEIGEIGNASNIANLVQEYAFYLTNVSKIINIHLILVDAMKNSVKIEQQKSIGEYDLGFKAIFKYRLLEIEFESLTVTDLIKICEVGSKFLEGVPKLDKKLIDTISLYTDEEFDGVSKLIQPTLPQPYENNDPINDFNTIVDEFINKFNSRSLPKLSPRIIQIAKPNYVVFRKEYNLTALFDLATEMSKLHTDALNLFNVKFKKLYEELVPSRQGIETAKNSDEILNTLLHVRFIYQFYFLKIYPYHITILDVLEKLKR